MSLDSLALYHAWRDLDNGARAQLRRVASPDELKDIPVFYRLVKPFNWETSGQKHALLRMVFCLTAGNNAITHQPSEEGKPAKSLGCVLAQSGKINERRVYQLIRAESPNDLIQLRRLLVQAEPTLDWVHLANMLLYWGTHQKRRLLEDFVLSSNDKK
ncbi:type I-E CRISPR-associated protein Cse2/CasB [Cronobacter sakazakii]|uniref:Type I-E CRISPR-associated protein Cse2/CasB n=1 Tax=Cronobacter sakazakii TaxID=28141 RepID=A0AA45BZS2_CROSK|nr:type I-E CRISPR-associated protein Cse2/CasB [Cronobacter sakazakii]EIZ8954298.1 type I-E CRISPR-associated protein Cse2/CasB [Cronobacter sakazakii]EKM1390166.1 type I-E CRISPR-associated protein Cse2/CasB [Cronobacter sakazakii]EKM6440530.1 type I-E CRISPR-associated protein Cse2/CasB [Cronobacter sakazakii]ELQ6016151.1 type I-E CRISPR-associated protein Cse2/CasB [Cronobacter sakazakii]ELY3572936.1 type I-E CRISPR-associated protein Cse2/CasB [Cronobacter sakazakii]